MRINPTRVLKSVLHGFYRETGVDAVSFISGGFRFDFTLEESLDETGFLFWFVNAGETVHQTIGFAIEYPFELEYDFSSVTAMGWRVNERAETDMAAVTLCIWCVFDALMAAFESGQCQVMDRILVIEDRDADQVLEATETKGGYDAGDEYPNDPNAAIAGNDTGDL